MLTDVKLNSVFGMDPVMLALRERAPKRKREGVYVTGLNFRYDFDSEGWEDYPEFDDGYCAYGVCDGIDQFFEHPLGKLLKADESRKFAVSFCHIEKDPEPYGWRWHKWGPYIGKGEPECEYLADEEGFDGGVWVYHVWELKPW